MRIATQTTSVEVEIDDEEVLKLLKRVSDHRLKELGLTRKTNEQTDRILFTSFANEMLDAAYRRDSSAFLKAADQFIEDVTGRRMPVEWWRG